MLFLSLRFQPLFSYIAHKYKLKCFLQNWKKTGSYYFNIKCNLMYRIELKKKYQRTEQTMCKPINYIEKIVKFIIGISTRIVYIDEEQFTLLEKV